MQEIRYDAAGRQVEVISLPDDTANKAVTVTHYDGPRQDWTQDARGNVTSFEYDDLGRVVKTIHPATAHKVVDEDDAIQSASGPVYSHVGYDGFGRKLYETPPVGSADYAHADKYKIFTYDAGGRLTKVKMPAVDSTGVCPVYRYYYDAFGNQVAILDPLGRVTRFKYNELNLLTQRYQPFKPQLSDEPTTAEILNLSLNGILYESTEYDSSGRVNRQIDCKGQVTIVEYYSGTDYQSGSEFFGRPGQLKWKQYYTSNPSDPLHWNSRTVYLYDRLGRDKSQAIQDSWSNPTATTTSTSNEYDEEGRITRILSTEGDIHYVYSPLTGLKTATWTGTNINTATTKTDYTYDALGRLYTVQVTRRNSAAVTEVATTWTYNKNGSQEKVMLLPKTGPGYMVEVVV